LHERLDYLTRRLSLPDFGISLSLREAPRAIEQIDPHPAWAADLRAREARAGAERGRQ
jgi:hypothetical protein